MRKSFSSLLFVLLVGACTASGTGSARYSADVTMPRMVYIDADVQVIEDYDEPVFYTSNMYWRYEGGVWYQSRYHTRGWVRVSTPPAAIVRIERPTAYVHYHGSANANANGPRVESPREEHREAQQERREEKQQIQQEKREEKREEKAEKREEKREDKAEKREDKAEKREDKAEKREDKHDDHKGHKK